MRNEAISIETEKKSLNRRFTYLIFSFLEGSKQQHVAFVRERIALKGETSLVAFARYLEFIYTNT